MPNDLLPPQSPFLPLYGTGLTPASYPPAIVGQPTYAISTWQPNPQYITPNYFQDCLYREQQVFADIERCGGLNQICCPSAESTSPDGTPPWVNMPPQGRRIHKVWAQTVAAIEAQGAGVDLLLGSYQLPYGYDGVIASIVNQYTGTGFVEGSGILQWSIKLNRRWLKDYGQINTTLGSTGQPYILYRGGVRVYQHTTIGYYARISTLGMLDPAQLVLGGVFGWEYPRN